MLNRRRFLSIAAAASLAPGLARATPVHVETGVALGARVTLRLAHPDAPALAAAAMEEIRRLERIFSLYLPGSALVRLNETGRAEAPAFELLDCLTVAGAVHGASGGRFDPTVQTLWQAEARARERGAALTPAERQAALARTGWAGVTLDAGAITLRPGVTLTLNGIAQGYVADRVAAFLAQRGLEEALIDTGEMVALAGRPGSDGWPVRLSEGGSVALRGRALATSAPLGMTFGGDGRTSHILDPIAVRPVAPLWRAVSISAPRAAVADALSTAACLMPDAEAVARLCRPVPGARVEAAVPA
jgi:thiamine biosynthesis lipoprotein